VSSKVSIPSTFASGVIAERGDAGLLWLEALPDRIEDWCTRWSLIIDGPPWHGYLGLVLPVRRGDELCALKVTWVDDETKDEALALQLWDGRGAVKLLDAQPDEGVLLLERLDATCSLDKIEIDEAVTIAGRLLRQLAIPAPPAPPALPLQRHYAQRQAATMYKHWEKLGRPFSQRLIDLAQEAAEELAPSVSNLLVNQDLHYDNVLAGKREPWLVIDPKVIVGDVEFGVAPLLWNRLEHDPGADLSQSSDLSQSADSPPGSAGVPPASTDLCAKLSRRFALLLDSAELDSHRARCWTMVRCVDYWLWALNIGLTEDPLRCKIIIEWLLQSA